MDGLWLLMPLKGVAEFFLLSIQSFNFMCLFTVPYCIATKHINFFGIKTLNPKPHLLSQGSAVLILAVSKSLQHDCQMLAACFYSLGMIITQVPSSVVVILVLIYPRDRLYEIFLQIYHLKKLG